MNEDERMQFIADHPEALEAVMTDVLREPGMTQAEIARRSDASPRSIADYRRGRVPRTRSVLRNLVRFLGARVDRYAAGHAVRPPEVAPDHAPADARLEEAIRGTMDNCAAAGRPLTRSEAEILTKAGIALCATAAVPLTPRLIDTMLSLAEAALLRQAKAENEREKEGDAAHDPAPPSGPPSGERGP